ncbi:MAG: hypothetical protein A3F17_02510 [Gammaproteobacteria bacterium RIFCSPHIGHO2_12_FULL_41_15]|nr:MAG: hypothetical protein A3F17_02510 [Gammaproteobacteria bacterium RIFCSPHIGHO2_12_FULL_41_15]
MQSIKKILLVFLCLLSISVMAATGPVDVLQSTSNNIVSSLAKLKQQGKLQTNYIVHLVHRDLIPLVDAEQMAMAVVGRQYWNSATPAEKKAFIKEFQTLVINTYAAAFASYNNDQVKVYPLRTTPNEFANVKSIIIRPNGNKIAVNYDMSKSNAGWKVTDFSIENISLINNYRAQFKPVLRQQGFVGLIKRLAAKNRQS